MNTRIELNGARGSIQWGITALFVAAGLLIAISVLVILRLHGYAERADVDVSHTYEVVSCLNSARAKFESAQSAQRGYLMADDRDYLAERDNSLLRMNAELRQCTDLTADNSHQQVRLRELMALLVAREASFDKQRQLHLEHNMDQLVRLLAEARLSNAAIYSLFDEMLSEEGRLLSERQAASQRESQQFEWVLSALALVCAVLLLTAAVTMMRYRRSLQQMIADLRSAHDQTGTAARTSQQLVLNAVPAAMLMADTNGRIAYVNVQLCALFGYSREELLGQPLELLVPQRFHREHAGLREAYTKNPTARAMGAGRELFGLRRDGSEVPIEIGLNPLVTDDGHFILASIIDISERRREEERLRLVIEAAPSAMLMVNAHGHITLVNTQVERLFGYSREELLGQPIEMLVPLRFRQPHAGFRQRFSNQPEARSMGAGRDLYGLRRDGAEVPIEIGLNPIETLEGRFVLASVIDISERKRVVEEELRRASEALASRFDETRAAALTLFNTEFDEQRVLAGTLELLAERHQFPISLYYSANVSGDYLLLTASRGAPANATKSMQVGAGLVGTAAQTGRSIYIDQVEAGHGLTIQAGFVELQPTALLFCPVSYRGQLLGVLALGASERLADIDRSSVERLVSQLGAALHNIKQYANLQVLAQELRERGEEIQLKNNQLEAASRMKSEFLANMSHELRTPLNAVIGFSEVLRDGLVGEMNAKQTECVTDIFASGQHLLALINDILDLSKIEAGRLDVDLEAADPIAIVESGLTIVREKAMNQRVRLVQQWPENLGQLALDVRKVKQIVFNLLSNAVKFTEAGGEITTSVNRIARVQMQQALAQVTGRSFIEACTDAAEYLQIRIADTGIGIEPDDLARLFEPFTQVDSALSRRHAGTGLGLAMVRRLTELLGGALTVDSRVGGGSIFTIWLPWLQVPPKTAIALAVPVPRNAATPPLVLIVEDRAQDAQLLRMQLVEAGYRVALATTAEHALTLIETERPDAIVLDVILPGMNGWDLLSQLKGRADLAGIPVVIVSVTDEAQRGFVLGAADVLVKPVSQGQLMQALRHSGLLPLAPHRVLVIDDDPRSIALLTGQLQSAGFHVQSADGGREGIALAQSLIPDLIVLDLMMPDVNGFDVITALRAESSTAAIPVLILTAHDISPLEREALHGATQRIIEKSEFLVSEFIAEVRRVVNKHAD